MFLLTLKVVNLKKLGTFKVLLIKILLRKKDSADFLNKKLIWKSKTRRFKKSMYEERLRSIFDQWSNLNAKNWNSKLKPNYSKKQRFFHHHFYYFCLGHNGHVQKYSRLRCLLGVEGLVIGFYLGWSGSILRFRKI